MWKRACPTGPQHLTEIGTTISNNPNNHRSASEGQVVHDGSRRASAPSEVPLSLSGTPPSLPPVASARASGGQSFGNRGTSPANRPGLLALGGDVVFVEPNCANCCVAVQSLGKCLAGKRHDSGWLVLADIWNHQTPLLVPIPGTTGPPHPPHRFCCAAGRCW